MTCHDLERRSLVNSRLIQEVTSTVLHTRIYEDNLTIVEHPWMRVVANETQELPNILCDPQPRMHGKVSIHWQA